MLANVVKETTTTAGVGTITLVAHSDTSFVRVSTQFAVGARVALGIKDGNNREWGVYTVAAGNTVERTFILATLVAGTYLDSSDGTLTPITLSGSSADVFGTDHEYIRSEPGLQYLQVPPDGTRMDMPLLGAIHYMSDEAFGDTGTSRSTIGNAEANTGTLTARAFATTNKLTSSKRLGLVSVATAGGSAERRYSIYTCWRGDAAGLGGFNYIVKCAVSDAALVSDARMFVGLAQDSGGLANVDPSTMNKTVGLAIDAADANFSIQSKDTAGATKVDLGANFSRAAIGTNLTILTLQLWAPPNAAFIGYRVVADNATKTIATGVITATLPVNTTKLFSRVWRNNAATAAAVGIDFLSMSMGSPQ